MPSDPSPRGMIAEMRETVWNQFETTSVGSLSPIFLMEMKVPAAQSAERTPYEVPYEGKQGRHVE